MADVRTRHGRGLFVVVVLGVIFFTLLGLIVFKTGGKDGAAVAAAESLTVLPVRIRIRTEPNARAAVVATATSNETVKMLEDQGTWARVQTADGLTGWAERANLERTAERTRRLARYAAIRKLPPLQGSAQDRALLYAGPGIFYPMVGELPADSRVTVFTRDHDFYAIDFKGTVAYADVESIDVSASGSPQLNVNTTPAPGEPGVTPDPSAPPATETAVAEVPPSAEPEPVPEPEPPVAAERSTGVYSAVPAGGTQPEELDRVVPRYPPLARSRGIQGSVVVRGIVRRDGTIDNVEVIKDLPFGLGDAARDAVRRWQFRPASYRGEPIDVYYTVTVNFRLQ